jgi:hypothetical protein
MYVWFDGWMDGWLKQYISYASLTVHLEENVFLTKAEQTGTNVEPP